MSPLTRQALALTSLALALGLFAATGARANDGIFPPAPAAASAISFDGKGFTIRGNPTFIASGSIHYPRVPRALWRDRLLRLKRAGFNTVETYAFWNYHEPQEGKWEFTGEKDLGHFLDLAHEMGLYAIVRVGPYVCAEWDSGGYPVWLRFKPGLRVREDNPAFLQYTDRWYEKVIPLVAKRQVHRGGGVILVQLENEHPLGWGTEMPNGYFRHLLEKSRALGLEVPTFFSGLHHSHDPAGNRPWDGADRANPWLSTEFWAGWFDRYGPANPADLRTYDRAAWKVIAYGGGGYNDYMLHGGTNFAQWGTQENDASYDYGAAIGQAGDLRPLYYRFKRANLFAHSFANILRNSVDATEEFRDAVPGVTVTAQKSAAGTLMFLDNPTEKEATVRSGDTAMRVLPGEILPVVRDAALANGLRLESSAARILLVQRKGGEITMVVYGPPGDSGAVTFRRTTATRPVAEAGTELTESDDLATFTLRVRFQEGAPEEHRFTSGPARVRVLAMSAAMADRTWLIEHAGGPWIVCGPDYVSGYTVKNGRLAFRAENRTSGKRDVVAYGPNDQVRRYGAADSAAPKAPALSAWAVRRADREAEPSFDDRAWKSSVAPPEMGTDGSISPYAWYRAAVDAPRAGTYQLGFRRIGDRIRLYVNGKAVSTGEARPSRTVELKAGRNHIAALAIHDGRDKLFNYLGPLSERDPKGIIGPVTLSPAPARSLRLGGWRWMPAADAGEASRIAAGPSGADGWRDAGPEQDVFNGRRGFAVYRASLSPSQLPGGHREVWFENVDDNAAVYLNGRKLAEHRGWGQPFGASLDAAWRADGSNELAVVVENTDGPGGVMGAVELHAYAGTMGALNGTPVRNWRLRGGLSGGTGEGADWTRFRSATGSPAFYRSRFTLPAGTASNTGSGTVFRFYPGGLGRGMAWLNGHNLGRYPDRLVKDGLYLPECWLRPGENTLEVFDESGGNPANARIIIEQSASRIPVLYTETGRRASNATRHGKALESR